MIKNKDREKEEWLNEHGEPDFVYLKSLTADGGPQALEKLYAIADDLDVEYDPGMPPENLTERIRSVTSKNDDGGQRNTT